MRKRVTMKRLKNSFKENMTALFNEMVSRILAGEGLDMEQVKGPLTDYVEKVCDAIIACGGDPNDVSMIDWVVEALNEVKLGDMARSKLMDC